MSDEEGAEQDEDVDMASGDDEAPALEREFVKPQQALALSTAAPPSAKKNTQPFNPSGSLGVVVEPVASSAPVASTSTNAPAPASATAAPPAVGSALAAGATVTIVKRAPKQRGRMRELIGAVGKGKGKAKVEPEPEEESSDFDSSEASGDEEDDDEDDEDDEEGEEWKGIEGEEGPGEKVDGSDASDTGDGAGGNGEAESDDVDSEDEESDDEGDEEGVKAPPRERGAFRAWADEQVRQAAGVDEAAIKPVEEDDGTYKPLLPAGSGFKNKVDSSGITGPLGAVLPKEELPTLPPQKTVHIAVTRTPEIEASRAELPVVKEEDRVMQAIRGNPVVVICGETGSGKTTQIGQFLWEAGFGDSTSGALTLPFRTCARDEAWPDRCALADNPGMVAITQPRRVAALSTSARVRAELGLADDSSLVAHRIRYSTTASSDTKLVFMTDGVLLRELAADFLLTKYSVVVVDEAHERGVNTDVLIGVLSRVAKLREKQWRAGQAGAKVRSVLLRLALFLC